MVIWVAMRGVFECVDGFDVVCYRGFHRYCVVGVVLVPAVDFGLPVRLKLLP